MTANGGFCLSRDKQNPPGGIPYGGFCLSTDKKFVKSMKYKDTMQREMKSTERFSQNHFPTGGHHLQIFVCPRTNKNLWMVSYCKIVLNGHPKSDFIS